MKAAQELYEGVEAGELGTVGLITYMRTDSLRISEEARQAGNEFITETFGEKYLPKKPRYFKSKSNIQDGHEAIRPSMQRLHLNRLSLIYQITSIKFISLYGKDLLLHLWNLACRKL